MPKRNMDKNTYLSEPSVTVGIVSGKEVTFSLHGRYAAEGRQADGTVLPLAPSSYAASRLTLRISPVPSFGRAVAFRS